MLSYFTTRTLVNRKNNNSKKNNMKYAENNSLSKIGTVNKRSHTNTETFVLFILYYTWLHMRLVAVLILHLCHTYLVAHLSFAERMSSHVIKGSHCVWLTLLN